MLKARKAEIELTEFFHSIDVTSSGNDSLKITCFAGSYSVNVVFRSFVGLENRSEFFDRRNGQGIVTPQLPGSGYYYPITYIDYPDFKDDLSEYESTVAGEKLTLWRFLSIENFVEVYSYASPVLEKVVLAS